LQVAVVTQLVAPPSRLRQQTLPPVQAEPSRHPMFAPPMHVAPALMHMVPVCVTQQDCTPGVQVI